MCVSHCTKDFAVSDERAKSELGKTSMTDEKLLKDLMDPDKQGA